MPSPLQRRRSWLWTLLFVVPIIGLVIVRKKTQYGKHFKSCTKPCIPGNESIMRQKEHGTSRTPVQSNLRWNCDVEIADRICNYNRHYAEYSGYWERGTTFLQEMNNNTTNHEEITFYDSNTGLPLITLPGYLNRSFDEFVQESHHHGWPSFRDDEINWKYVRVLDNGETVSTSGTHLGHNLPDSKGNRYCLNIVSLAGTPIDPKL
jgi:peptide methionine sulfoxide reductase MsrB